MGTIHGNQEASVQKYEVKISELYKVQDCAPFVICSDAYGNLYQQYKVFVHTSQALQEELKIYELRRKQCEHLVNVCCYQIVNREFEDSGYMQLEVFTERIPMTLSQCNRIPFEKGLTVLLEATIAFQMIFKEAGVFQINDGLIGFDTKDKVKVWFNSNWALNTKIHTKTDLNQNGMVLKLIHNIEKHIELSTLMINWLENRRQIKDWKFTVLKEFISKFVVKKRLKINSQFANQTNKKTPEKNKNQRLIKMRSNHFSPPLQFFNASISLGNKKNQLSPLISTYDDGLRKTIQFDLTHKFRPTSPPILMFDEKQRKNKSHKVKNSQNLSEEAQDTDRIRRNSEYITPGITLSFKPREKRQKKRNPVASQQIIRQAKSMIAHSKQTLNTSQYMIAILKAEDNKASPLEKVRKQLRNYIGEKKEPKQLRTSCSNISENELNDSEEMKQQNSIQFKNHNMKRKKPKVEISVNPFLGLVNNRQPSPVSKDSSVEYIRKRNSSVNVFGQSLGNYHTANGLLSQKTIQKKQKTSIFTEKRIDSLRTPTMKSAGNSIIIHTTRPDASMITLASRARQLKQSMIAEELGQNTEVRTQSEESRSIRLPSLRSKSIMTRSITLSTPKKKEKKTAKKERVLNKLDMLLIQKNLEKNKEKQSIFNESIDLEQELALVTSVSSEKAEVQNF